MSKLEKLIQRVMEGRDVSYDEAENILLINPIHQQVTKGASEAKSNRFLNRRAVFLNYDLRFRNRFDKAAASILSPVDGSG